MAKAILLVRVSTEKQSFDEQEKQLYDMAVADGYADSDIISITEKESGIRLSEEQRKGLNRMKDVIATEDVAVVYAWEISRIARRKKILFNILDLLTSKKIQLKIYDPFIALLNSDGTINEASETIFTLFAQMAESEMRNKAARFHRTKKAMAAEGQWVGGGKPHFGYYVDDDGYYQINKEEANIIRTIFDLYVNGDMGYMRLAKEMTDRGYPMTSNKISKILSDPVFTGEHTMTRTFKGGIKRTYNKRKWPVIIDKDTWDKATAKRAEGGKYSNKSSNYWFANGLITCPHCGRHWVVKGKKSYACSNRCGNAIGINLMDSLLWNETKLELETDLAFGAESKIAEYRKQIEVFEQKKAVCEKTIANIETRLEKVGELYESGVYSQEKMLKRTSEIQAESAKAENDIVLYTNNIKNLMGLIDNIKNRDTLTARLNKAADMVENMEDVKMMYGYIHQYIDKVEVSDYDRPLKGHTDVKKIVVYHKSGEVNIFYYLYRVQKGTKLYAQVLANDPYARQGLIEKQVVAPMDYDDDFKQIVRVKRTK